MDASPPKPLRDKRYRYIKWAVMSFCGITLVMTIIVMSITLPYLNSYSYSSYYYTQNQINTSRALIITVGVLSILAQFGGLWGAYKDHYYISLSYGIGSILLAGLCIVSAIVGAGGIDWLLIIFFVICGSLGCQLSREIKRTNRMPVLNQTVYMNPGIQPNMVYQMPNTGQPAYMVQGGQVQTGPMYMSPTLTAVQTMPAQSGQIFVSSPQYPTSQVVAFPTPGPSYGGSSTSPPTYTQSQEDISRMSVNEQPSGAQGAPGGSNSYLNENIEERKTIPN